MSKQPDDLTIGNLAAATGVSVAVLRAWEARFGFPAPRRSSSGHRRYSDADRQQVEDVLRLRAAGLSLVAAIAEARRHDDDVARSVFAHLRSAHPWLPAHLLDQETSLAISRAIEDECCAQAERPVLIGGFERERFYRASERRWRELSRTSALAMVMADFATSARPRGGPIEVRLAPSSPLRREWLLICDAPDAAACLAAWERPRARSGDRRRVFEAVWSVDPLVVRDATRAAVAAATEAMPDLAAAAPQLHPPADPAAVLRRATGLMNRIVAYMQDGVGR